MLNKQFAAIHFKDGERDRRRIRHPDFRSGQRNGPAREDRAEISRHRAAQVQSDSIETLVDLDTLTIEELVCRLKAAEERYNLDADGVTGEQLLLTEEWRARRRRRRSPSRQGP